MMTTESGRVSEAGAGEESARGHAPGNALCRLHPVTEQTLSSPSSRGWWWSVSHLRLPRVPKPKIFFRRRCVTISDVDPQHKVVYLGNVVTTWAKGDGCVDRPLATLWKNHMASKKPQMSMKVTITAQGLKAVTKEHGLTEYWANRITFCSADPSYPRIFCWVYRHEGRRMKQELRCHAVLCSSDRKAASMSDRLHERLAQALADFKREKVARQNARLSLANAVYDHPTMPQRRVLLHTGSSNYRPHRQEMARGRAALRLGVIEENSEEETDGNVFDENHLSLSPGLLKRSVSSPFDSFPVESKEMSLLEDILSELPSLAPGYLSCRDLSTLDPGAVTCLEDVSLDVDVDGCGDDVSDESGYSESASGTSNSPRADAAAAAYAYCDSLATHVAKALQLYPLETATFLETSQRCDTCRSNEEVRNEVATAGIVSQSSLAGQVS